MTQNKTLIIASDLQQNCNQILELIPLSEEIVKLKAICDICKNTSASFQSTTIK